MELLITNISVHIASHAHHDIKQYVYVIKKPQRRTTNHIQTLVIKAFQRTGWTGSLILWPTQVSRTLVKTCLLSARARYHTCRTQSKHLGYLLSYLLFICSSVVIDVSASVTLTVQPQSVSVSIQPPQINPCGNQGKVHTPLERCTFGWLLVK